MHTCRKATIFRRPKQLSALSLHYFVGDEMGNLKRHSKTSWITFKRIYTDFKITEPQLKNTTNLTTSWSFQCSSAQQRTLRNLETRELTSRRPQLCTNQVPSRSMQKPLRSSRGADRRTDSFSALYIVEDTRIIDVGLMLCESVCVCVCVRACVRACVRVCVGGSVFLKAMFVGASAW